MFRRNQNWKKPVCELFFSDWSCSSVTGVFLRWNRSSKCLDEAYEEMVHIIEYNKELQTKVNSLRRQLAQLETEDPLLHTP